MNEAMPHRSATRSAALTAVPSRDALPDTAFVVPQCSKGIGHVIAAPGSPDLIDGVVVTPYSLWSDDRGYFLEAMRAGCGPIAGFPLETTQVSATLSYPGSIKAFHYHRHQTDCWIPSMGTLQVALVDLRPDSPTFGRRNTMYVGVMRPWRVNIPPGVGHGYKALGNDPSMLIYVTSRFYDSVDEGRIAYDDARINYDWTVQHK
jgi:dTDP-4-dehydrorhamnose 3,5-epimerase